jgi:hypothetical protein
MRLKMLSAAFLAGSTFIGSTLMAANVDDDSLKGRFGVSLGLGFSPGNRTTTNVWSPTDQLTVDRGSGLTWAGQVLYGLSDDLEAGFGVLSPVGFNLTGNGKLDTGSVNTSYDFKYEEKFSGLPIMAGVRYHVPTSSKLGFFGGLGLGWFTGGDDTSSTSRDYAISSPSYDSTGSATSSYGGGIAYRSELGTEYKFTRSFSLEFAFSMLVYPLTQTSYSSSTNYTNQAGGPAGRSTSKSTYKDNPTKPKAQVNTTVDNRDGGGTGTVVSTSDTGASKSVQTTHYVLNAYQYMDWDNTSESPLMTLWMTQMNMSLAAVMRF